MEFRGLLHTAVKDVAYGSTTPVEEWIASNLICAARVVPPVIDEAAAYFVSRGVGKVVTIKVVSKVLSI